MTWDKISDDLAIWTLPGERTKNSAASHRAPQCAPVPNLLTALLPDYANKRGANSGLLPPGAVAPPLRDGLKPSARSIGRIVVRAEAFSARTDQLAPSGRRRSSRCQPPLMNED
jgi:hypothetical protein